MTHESKWIAEKQCWRLVHPETGDFIAEYYPFVNQLVVTKHRKTAVIDLNDYQVLKATVTSGMTVNSPSKTYILNQ